MAINQAAKKKLSSNVKTRHELEEKIFQDVCANRYFAREMAYPFAVLENDTKKVVLGSNAHITSRVNASPILQIEIREIVSKALGGVDVGVEVKNARDEFLETQKRIDKKIAKDKEEERILAEVEGQKIEGKCNLIPFPAKENKTRSDLTVERHSLFAANTFKGDFRSHERKIRNHETRETSTLRVEIGDRDGQVRGVLKQKHQEAFYKLSQMWAKQNYQIKHVGNSSFGYIEVSAYELTQKLRADDGGKTYKEVMLLLKEMSSIRIDIRKIHVDGTCDIKNFALLSYESHATYFNEGTLKTRTGGESRIHIIFSDFVTNSFLRKDIKTLMLDPYFKLKDKGRKGVSQLLYTMLDYELSTKEKFNISLVNLSKRLGITQYGFKSKRKQVLQGSIDTVNGSLILDEKHKIHCHMVESEDERDWILIATRVQP
ncbi:MAG: replication initiator protein A [Minisyncoccia bacterium]